MQARQVADRRTLAAAVAQRPIRFAIEIDHQEVVADRHQMPELVVAVTADAHGLDAVQDAPGLAQQRLLAPEHPVGRLAQRLRQRVPPALSRSIASRTWPRIDWYSDRWYIGVNGSGAKAASVGSEASATCISAVRRAISRAVSR